MASETPVDSGGKVGAGEDGFCIKETGGLVKIRAGFKYKALLAVLAGAASAAAYGLKSAHERWFEKYDTSAVKVDVKQHGERIAKVEDAMAITTKLAEAEASNVGRITRLEAAVEQHVKSQEERDKANAQTWQSVDSRLNTIAGLLMQKDK